MGAWMRLFVTAGLLVIAGSHAAAQQPTFQSATELVSMNVSVTGSHDQPVEGLTANQFAVFEDGVPQELKFFSPGELPLDVVILLDTSASMSESMPLVKQAAIKFARALRAGDRASVMGISNGLRVLQEFTSDIASVEQAIDSATVAGRTPLYASIYTALKEVERYRRAATEPRRQAIVVLSDGQDTASGFGFDELLDVIRRHAVPIYTIAPRPTKSTRLMREQIYGETTRVADFELRTLATETGARSFFPVNVLELSGVYGQIATELAHQYSLAYQSSNVTRDGGFHRIMVKITGPGLKWRTRAGYLAQRGSTASAGGDH